MDEDPSENTPRRRRGPYKRYLDQTDVSVPESTIRSRNKRAQQIQEQQQEHDIPGRSVNLDEELHENINDIRGRSVNLDAELHENINDIRGRSVNLDAELHENINDIPGRSVNVDEELHENMPEDNNHEGRKHVDYVQKYSLNERLHPDFPALSKLDVLLMILHLSIRHCHTENFVKHQLEFVNALFGRKVLDISYYIFKEVFPPASSLVKYYFCPTCELMIGTDKDLKNVSEASCPNPPCSKKINVKSVDSGNYFIIFNLREQIELLLQRSNCKLIDLENREATNNLRDLFDGDLYKKFAENGINKKFLTCNFNTDGVAVYKSTQSSMYPILMHLNEIVPEDRFQVGNVIVGGLWFGKGAPNMALYLKPFMEQLLDLSQNGVKHFKSDGSFEVYPVYPIACSVDSITKPKILCKKQFNAFCACPYCYDPNNVTIEGKNQRFYQTNVSYPVRSEEEVVRDMYEADRKDRAGDLKKDSVNGFLGISILLLFHRYIGHIGFNPFHIVWGVVIDYMHAVLEGVTSQLLDLYLKILTSDQIAVLNERISNICPPQAMTRKPRTTRDKIKWKAKESRAFILYYALPCLEDLLPHRNFSNLKLFVQSLHVLLSDNICRSDLAQARISLSSFITGFQNLYGIENVTFNLHLISHLCDQVEKMGPLWGYSNMIFESANGRLVSLVKGTRSVINEIATKFTKLQSIPNIIAKNQISDAALTFCDYVLGSKYYSKRGVFYGDVCVTSSSFCKLRDVELRVLEESNILATHQEIKSYDRAIRNGIIYTSRSFTKAKVYDDSCVKLSDGQYAVIERILSTSDNEELVCLIRPIAVAEIIVPSVFRCSFDCLGDLCVVPFQNIVRKSFFLSVGEKNFVCDLPNSFERD